MKSIIAGLVLLLTSSLYATGYGDGSIPIYVDVPATNIPQSHNYIEGTGGLANDSWGIRFGHEFKMVDVSAGYNKIGEDEIDIHTLGVEVAPYFSLWTLKVKGILGFGYSLPDYPSGPTKADNDVSYTLGVGTEWKFSEHWSIGADIRSLFFTTDTHNNWESSHAETLSTGQEVEVVDHNHSDNSRSFNTARVNMALKYSF